MSVASCFHPEWYLPVSYLQQVQSDYLQNGSHVFRFLEKPELPFLHFWKVLHHEFFGIIGKIRKIKESLSRGPQAGLQSKETISLISSSWGSFATLQALATYKYDKLVGVLFGDQSESVGKLSWCTKANLFEKLIQTGQLQTGKSSDKGCVTHGGFVMYGGSATHPDQLSYFAYLAGLSEIAKIGNSTIEAKHTDMWREYFEHVEIAGGLDTYDSFEDFLLCPTGLVILFILLLWKARIDLRLDQANSFRDFLVTVLETVFGFDHEGSYFNNVFGECGATTTPEGVEEMGPSDVSEDLVATEKHWNLCPHEISSILFAEYHYRSLVEENSSYSTSGVDSRPHEEAAVTRAHQEAATSHFTYVSGISSDQMGRVVNGITDQVKNGDSVYGYGWVDVSTSLESASATKNGGPFITFLDIVFGVDHFDRYIAEGSSFCIRPDLQLIPEFGENPKRSGNVRETIRLSAFGFHLATNLEHLSSLEYAIRNVDSDDRNDDGRLTFESRHYLSYPWSLQETREGRESKLGLAFSEFFGEEHGMVGKAYGGISAVSSSKQAENAEKLSQQMENALRDEILASLVSGSSAPSRERKSPISRLLFPLFRQLKELLEHDEHFQGSDFIVGCEPVWLCGALNLAFPKKKIITRLNMCPTLFVDQLLYPSILSTTTEITDDNSYDPYSLENQTKLASLVVQKLLQATTNLSTTCGYNVKLWREIMGPQQEMMVSKHMRAQHAGANSDIPSVPMLGLWANQMGTIKWERIAQNKQKKTEVLLFKNPLPYQQLMESILSKESGAKSIDAGVTTSILNFHSPAKDEYYEFSELVKRFAGVVLLPHVVNALRLSDMLALRIPVFSPGIRLGTTLIYSYNGMYCGRTLEENRLRSKKLFMVGEEPVSGFGSISSQGANSPNIEIEKGTISKGILDFQKSGVWYPHSGVWKERFLYWSSTEWGTVSSLIRFESVAELKGKVDFYLSNENSNENHQNLQIKIDKEYRHRVSQAMQWWKNIVSKL